MLPAGFVEVCTEPVAYLGLIQRGVAWKGRTFAIFSRTCRRRRPKSCFCLHWCWSKKDFQIRISYHLSCFPRFEWQKSAFFPENGMTVLIEKFDLNQPSLFFRASDKNPINSRKCCHRYGKNIAPDAGATAQRQGAGHPTLSPKYASVKTVHPDL